MKPDWPLETERLVLRPYTDDDLESLHAVYSDAEVVRWLYYGPSTLEQSREKLARKMMRGPVARRRVLKLVRVPLRVFDERLEIHFLHPLRAHDDHLRHDSDDRVHGTDHRTGRHHGRRAC